MVNTLVIVLAVLASSEALLAPFMRVDEKIDGKYLVKVKDGYSIDKVTRNIQNDPFFNLIGGKVRRIFRHVVQGFEAELSSPALDFIRRLSWVEYVTEDGIVRAMYDVDSWGLDRVDQRDWFLDNEYNPKYHGNGVTVYVIDTGVRPTHVDVAGRCQIGADMVNPDPRDGYGEDCNGHGSHCSGVVGGTLYGVAKNAQLVGVRVLGCLGSGSTAQVVGGMDWVAANANKPAVVSMSLGGGGNQMTDDGVIGLRDAGILTVAAAGNSARNACNTSPARSPYAVTVGATSLNDTRASYSNHGECLNIFAPGTLIKSIWNNDDEDTRAVSGTSMACPHVAGAAALYLETNPSATPSVVQAYLMNTATQGVVSNAKVPDEINRLLYVETV
ncbi:aqualysin-1-like [Apostichopus japonicus]|uniref:aqualysin-1-like n=1 Tax=Stichopus japonicus TaxID=307972 RepID=UPI003AB4D39E